VPDHSEKPSELRTINGVEYLIVRVEDSQRNTKRIPTHEEVAEMVERITQQPDIINVFRSKIKGISCERSLTSRVVEECSNLSCGGQLNVEWMVASRLVRELRNQLALGAIELSQIEIDYLNHFDFGPYG